MSDQKFQVKLLLALGESTCEYSKNVVLTGWIKLTVRNRDYVFRCYLHRVVSYAFECFLSRASNSSAKKASTWNDDDDDCTLTNLSYTARDETHCFWDFFLQL